MVTINTLAAGEDKVAVVGLGYVGLPLAVHLADHFKVVGYDLNELRVQQLAAGHDTTMEVDAKRLEATSIQFTSDAGVLAECRLLIAAVPTPIDQANIPELSPLRQASITIGQHLSPGGCVVFESTVYPGATEEVCVPLLESESGLKMGTDFSVGYSPERINPGDKVHTLDNIKKIVSGSDDETLTLLAEVYGTVVKAGIHKAPSIKVAEAAKVIENTQRDLNIALMNELAMIFDHLNIDTHAVLQAAGTKWNFLPFRPGLVGGHCIGVDPYYLTYKAQSMGYHPSMILAGRRVNDGMGKYVAEQTVKLLIRQGCAVHSAKVALLGLTFKENVPDLRNTKVVDIIGELRSYGVDVRVHDPLVDPEEAQRYYGLTLSDYVRLEGVDAVILAVTHDEFLAKGAAAIAGLCNSATGGGVLVDVKGAFSAAELAGLEVVYWRL
jgi:UDP-N-acetyl-D-galactosamine dehydrogenase